jgi:AraC family transcriptional regulator
LPPILETMTFHIFRFLLPVVDSDSRPPKSREGAESMIERRPLAKLTSRAADGAVATMSSGTSGDCEVNSSEPLAIAPDSPLSRMLQNWLREARDAARRDLYSVKQSLDRLEILLNQPGSEPCAANDPIAVAGGLAPWQLTRVKRYVEANLSTRLGTSDLAALVYLSKTHFTRAFKASLGCPPHAYVVGRRLNHAKMLMLENDLPLSQVALAAGLADQSHLSKLFRHFLGTTPSAWRRQHRACRSEIGPVFGSSDTAQRC